MEHRIGYNLDKYIKEQLGSEFLIFLQSNLHRILDWSKLSSNRNVTMNIIENNQSYPWVYHEVSVNPNLTMDFVNRNTDKPICWASISYHENITMDDIEKYGQTMLWRYISRNQI